ncbi:hypothetical protein [Roseovarius sp.]|uniref:preATP grasp domain-containing protein n=1 Tax=Roseovarius sp. TaxID=1486281 RepID=UPI0026395272|nr:hypothetical protein [Roseovarius sp.]
MKGDRVPDTAGGSQGHATKELARQLLRDEPALCSSLDFGPYVQQGQAAGTSLLIGDQAEIPLLHGVMQSRRDYRMALLARPSDLVLVRHRDRVYESYLAQHLDHAQVSYLSAPDNFRGIISKEADTWPALVDHLGAITASGNGLTLKAYLTTRSTWHLAKRLGEATGTLMHVCGPSPRVSRRVNDKLWFADLVHRLFGATATPPTMMGFDLVAAAAQISYLSKRADRVVAKVPDSAGSSGNIRFESTVFADKSPAYIQSFLHARLLESGWNEGFPILIGVWDSDVFCSPSVQLWIPHPDQGPPHPEGVFEQHVRGTGAAFVGAARSTLPDDLQTALTSGAIAIASVLQALGYFGRCSFDAVVCRTKSGAPTLHWIECNGRWGGVSIPMTLAKTLNSGRLPAGFLVVQELRPEMTALDTATCLARLDDLLYHARHTREGVILTAPPTAQNGVSINLLALADSQDTSEKLIDEAFSRLMISRHL